MNNNQRMPAPRISGLFALSRLLFTFTLVFLSFVEICGARQQGVTSASLSGVVRDANGAAVGGATVTATDLATNNTQSAESDREGRYRFARLTPGNYRLAVESPGFATASGRLTLTVGQALDVPLTLAVKGMEEAVRVVAGATVVEAARTQVAETIRPAEIDSYPLNGRNYLDLALLVPGVSRTNTGSVQRFAETSSVPGTGISIAGQRNLNNGFVVDGLSANDDAADLAGTFFSQDVIREFQVITSGGVAEFGRASGGFVNVVTQSGANDLRGRLYGFLRNQRLDARNPLAARRDPLTQAQYGATLGGPLRRDRTFFFANFEQTRRHDANVITIAPASMAAINMRLDRAGYAGPRIETGVIPAGSDTTNFFARVDHRPHATTQLGLRFSLYHIFALNSRGVGGLNASSRGSGLDDTDQTIAANAVTVLSPTSLNELRFQSTRSRLAAPVNDTVGPAVNISGVASFGTATSSPLARDTDLYELADSVSAQRGRHSLKGGGDLLLNRADIVFPGATQGLYTFTSLANFLSGTYGSFQQAFGSPSQFQSNPNAGLFVQDEWRPRNALTLNLGLRYDAQFLPAPIKTDSDNFSPRIGLAYSPGAHRWVVRAGLGLYYDRIPLRATSNALQRDGSKYVVVQLSSAQAGAPVFPNVLAAQPSNLPTRPNVTRIDPEIESGYSEQANLQVERELPGDASVSVGYLHLRGLHLIVSRNVNVPRFPASAGVPNLGRPDPNLGNVSRYESSGDSNYDALAVSFNKRASAWAGVRVSYTFSKAIDDAGTFFFSTPQSNFDLRDDRGLSDSDQRHHLVVSGTFEVPSSRKGASRRLLAGTQLGYFLTYASRLPFNVLTGNDRNFDTNFNDRPAGLGRNTGRGFDFASLDLRLSRRVHLGERINLDVFAEGFNLLNRANFSVPNSTFGTGATPLPGFGRPTAAFDPRQLQLGLKFNF